MQRLCHSSTAVREVLAPHCLHDESVQSSPNLCAILSDLAKLGDEQAATAKRRGHGWDMRDRRMRGVNHEEANQLMYHLGRSTTRDASQARLACTIACLHAFRRE